MDKKQLCVEKTLTTSEGKDQLDPTTEKHQTLKAIVREIMTEELGELKNDVREIKQTTQEFKQIEQLVLKVISNQEQSQQREQSMLKGQEKSESTLKKLEKPAFFAALSATPLGDLVIDFGKEVAKGMIGEERFEACGNAIKALIKPVSGPVLELISPLPSSLKIATAAILMLLVATFFLNHTASVWTPIRSGLAKLRSIFASKK